MKVLIVGTDLNQQSDLKTQGQYLRDLLVSAGWNATIVSHFRNPLIRIFDTIIQILKLNKGDVIIVQVYSTLGIYLEGLTVLTGWIKRTKIISTLHGGDIPNAYRSNPIKHFVLNTIIKHSNCITVPSTFISKNIPLLENNHLLIHNYVNLNEYENKPKPNDIIRIFWMRSYHPTYDPLKAIKILEYIRAQNIPAQLTMAGKDFGYLNEILTYIKSSQYAKDISIHNVIDNKTKNELASQCTVYLCTNKIDNAPVSFIEMMAMGLPIVTTNVGGIPYYVENEKQAIISKDNSIEDMANLIIQLHQNHELQNRIIANGITFSKTFSAEEVLKSWITILTNLHL
jgi:glycosyltransferase involved in cell wall biosynthesis